ncbi:RING/U-box superfamily protein [Perilla frutescens var. hirtella]|nr:RING/U-box superfamily protein [Perilla frutescens var. frutescens]KAH6794001.1 RING/U-box superfamily protein [Perilla frutescens var. hirtella]
MNPTSILFVSRRILQSTDIDAFNGIPESSPSPLTAAEGPNTSGARRLLDPAAAPFDSTMALTILILLTALFFLAFFSVYIRRFSTADIAPPPNLPKCVGGLDSTAVRSLPLVAYGGDAKHPMIVDCPICLSEFSERETVKLIPYCGHVFHPSCIDTWLASHVTCPLCRSAELFKRVEEVCLDVLPHEIAETSTPQNCDGCTSNLANPALLHTTTSF